MAETIRKILKVILTKIIKQDSEKKLGGWTKLDKRNDLENR